MLGIRTVFCLCSILLLGGCSTVTQYPEKGAKEVYRIAFDSSWYSLGDVPFGAALNGFFYDLLQGVGDVAGVILQPIAVQEPNLLVGLQNNSYEAICSLIYPYSYAQKEYTFSNPVLLTGPVLVASSDGPSSVPSSLSGKRIGILEGPFYAQQAQRIPGVLVEKVFFLSDAFHSLQDKRIDFFLVGIAQFFPYLKGSWQGNLKIVSGALDDQGLRLAVSKKAENDFLPLWEQALKVLRKNGSYNALLEKWGLWHLRVDKRWGHSLAVQREQKEKFLANKTSGMVDIVDWTVLLR